MKKYTIVIGILILFCSSSFAQYGYYDDPDANFGKKKEKKEDPKWVFGGELMLSFGQYTYIDVKPIAGYRITPRFIVGGGPIYIYENYYHQLESSTYGGRGIGQFIVIPDLSEYLNSPPLRIVVRSEYEYFYLQPIWHDPYSGYYFQDVNFYSVNNWLIGGGISQPLGRRMNLSITIMWDITHHPLSPHTNPIISVGIGI